MQRGLTIAALCGALLFSGAAALYAHGSPKRAETKNRNAAAVSPRDIVSLRPAKSANDVAERLDSVLQPRFLERGEDFGLSRIYIPLNAHQYTHRDANNQVTRQPLYALVGRGADEKKLVAEANAPRKEYVVAFLHGKNTLGKSGDKTPERDSLRGFGGVSFYFEPLVIHEADAAQNAPDKLALWFQTNLPEAEKMLSGSVVRARQGEKTSDEIGSYLVALRPVKAQASCLGCHGRAKTGDTLGVLVYAVKK